MTRVVPDPMPRLQHISAMYRAPKYREETPRTTDVPLVPRIGVVSQTDWDRRLPCTFAGSKRKTCPCPTRSPPLSMRSSLPIEFDAGPFASQLPIPKPLVCRHFSSFYRRCGGIPNVRYWFSGSEPYLRA